MWYLVDWEERSEHFKEGVRKLHQTQGKEVGGWEKEKVDLFRKLLPGSSDVDVDADVDADVDLDEFDHNLDFMVRDPGWLTDGDERSRNFRVARIKKKLMEGQKNDKKAEEAKRELVGTKLKNYLERKMRDGDEL